MYVVLAQCFPSRVGGIENLVSNLAISIGKNNKVLVLADRYHFLHDTIYDNKHKDRITVRRYGGMKFFRRRKKIKDLKLFIQSHQIQCVIADTWKSIELCIDDLHAQNIPVMCLAHGDELFCNNSNRKMRVSSTLDKASVIIANSNYTAGLVKQLIKNVKKIKVVYPGANDLCSLESDDFLKINGNPIILTLARLLKRKGHIFILQAIQKLKRKFPNIKYIIAGDGVEKTTLKRLVKKYNLQKCVFFTGKVNEEQKKFLFDITTIMVMPTLDESHKYSIEGFGIVYIEAAFFGIPSVASNIGGTPEAVLQDKTGIIIDNPSQLYQKINELLSNQNKLKQLGEDAKKRAKKSFTWDKVVINYLSTL